MDIFDYFVSGVYVRVGLVFGGEVGGWYYGGEYEKVIEYYRGQREGGVKSEGGIEDNLYEGNSYVKLGEYERGEEVYREGLRRVEGMEDGEGKSQLSYNIGRVYYERGEV